MTYRAPWKLGHRARRHPRQHPVGGRDGDLFPQIERDRSQFEGRHERDRRGDPVRMAAAAHERGASRLHRRGGSERPGDGRGAARCAERAEGEPDGGEGQAGHEKPGKEHVGRNERALPELGEHPPVRPRVRRRIGGPGGRPVARLVEGAERPVALERQVREKEGQNQHHRQRGRRDDCCCVAAPPPQATCHAVVEHAGADHQRGEDAVVAACQRLCHQREREGRSSLPRA